MREGSKEILAKMDTLETKVTRIEADVKTLGMKEEHGQILRAIFENKEVL